MYLPCRFATIHCADVVESGVGACIKEVEICVSLL